MNIQKEIAVIPKEMLHYVMIRFYTMHTEHFLKQKEYIYYIPFSKNEFK
jgi:hypothetical protein